ncbi:helix-turn-helix domain-containing protein [Halobaculum sp. CBA1158]|uniref:helix-turn-helix domain-containing protein n=1 Tax=Halobaculum sp. CBA1158 TaxID=2904243 RepID=UPI001F2523C3|nr:helix-turn-helix domain-containing protein [Halobaculum sp. CBA1158]UIO99589.1 helix-turn-helix domain-containing protein [Halobaculum sp. CBA1158]
MAADEDGAGPIRPMREVTLKIRHAGQPETVASERYPEVTMRSVSSMTGRSDERKRIVEITGDPDDVEGFIEVYAGCDPVDAAEPISPLGEPRVFVALTIRVPEWDSIAELFADHGVHHRTGTVIAGGWERWTLYLDADTDLSTVIDAIEDRGNDVKLLRQVEMDEISASARFEAAGALHDLTRRQREALAAAIRAGYYGHEKDAGVEDIAAELDIGTTTAWEHLARAEGKVMNDLGDFLGEE